MSLSNDDVVAILKLLDASDFDELRLETTEFTLHVRRSAPLPGTNGSEAIGSAARALESPSAPASPVSHATAVAAAAPGAAGPSAEPPTAAKPPTAATPPAAAPPPTPAAPPAAAAPPASAALAAAAGPPAPAAPAPAAAPPATAAPPAEVTVAVSGALVDVKTPLLGTFYRCPQPGAPPFVDVGSAVGVDTVIGIIEVMKLMSSVSAGVSGTVAEIPATDGALVEYGEVLMRIAPRGA